MKREELTELFCSKIHLEQARYKKNILKLTREEIYSRCYEIDCMINISETLLEKCESMDEDILKCLMVLPNLLGFFYSRWMKTGDSFQRELEESMEQGICSIRKKAGILGKENAA